LARLPCTALIFCSLGIADQGIRYQQNLAGRRIAIIELSTNKLRRLEAAAELLRSAVDAIKPSDFQRLVIP